MSIKESNFNAKNWSKLSHLLMVRAEGADPFSPYGQLDCKKTAFCLLMTSLYSNFDEYVIIMNIFNSRLTIICQEDKCCLCLINPNQVSLRGTVIIIANHGERIDIPAGDRNLPAFFFCFLLLVSATAMIIWHSSVCLWHC